MQEKTKLKHRRTVGLKLTYKYTNIQNNMNTQHKQIHGGRVVYPTLPPNTPATENSSITIY